MTEDVLPEGGKELGDPLWQPWRPEELAERLAGVRTPWCVAAGWAVDLFLGEQTREHEDLEIAVPEAGFAEIRQALPGLTFHVAGAGRLWPLDNRDAFSRLFQTWALDPATDAYRLDVFRDPHDGDTWVCRRDETLRMPYPDLVRYTADGIPYQRPGVVLLFKAKHSRDKDEADFGKVLPLLDAGERQWLRDALTRVHPDHRWLGRLKD